jgi:ribosomal-protein-alanine N-acetyltransferase
MDARYHIRPAVPSDASELAAIERRCFTDPWSEGSFREALGAVWSFGLVAANSNRARVTGYLIAREVAGTGEILNLAVAPESRRHGIARALLDDGLEALRHRRVQEVFLEVRESNLGAQALYQLAGFRPVGQRRGYYRNPKEDALVFRLDLQVEQG